MTRTQGKCRAGALLALLVASVAPVQAQLVLERLDRLASKATDKVEVTLDGALLRLGSQFLSSSDPDQARAKEIVKDLKGIYVRAFEFAETGQYSEADLEPLRLQLRGPTWARIVDIKSNKDGENTEVYLQTQGGKVSGLALISAEPKELTVVSIVGPLNLEDLSTLGGQFGIPKVERSLQPKPNPQSQPRPKREE